MKDNNNLCLWESRALCCFFQIPSTIIWNYTTRAQERETPYNNWPAFLELLRVDVMKYSISTAGVSRLSQGLPRIRRMRLECFARPFFCAVCKSNTLGARCEVIILDWWFIYSFACLRCAARSMIKLLAQIKLFWFHCHTHTHYMAAHGLLLFHSEKLPRSLTVFMITGVRAFDQGKNCRNMSVGNLCRENKRTCFCWFVKLSNSSFFCRLDW